MGTLKHFRYWCYKVIPLVYDDSLSYYEVLCKVVDYINNLISNDTAQGNDIEELQEAIEEIKNWINNFDSSYLEEIIASYLTDMIYVNISNAGYIIYYIPESWNDITFNTTGLDITNAQLTDNGHLGDYDYGRLVLSMYT